MTKMKKLMFALTLVVGVLAVGCGKKGGANDATTSASVTKVPEQAGTEESIGAEQQAGTEDGASSEEQTDSTNKEFNDRVVVSSVAVVQILDALGIPMVGVPTSSYELPESVKNATRIGSAMTPDLEVIASLEPSIVVSVDSLSEDLKTQFETLNMESIFVNLSSYDGLKEAILTLGERFDVSDKAAELVKNFEDKEKAIASITEGKEAPSVLIIFGAGQSFMVASESSYVGDLAKHVGAVNILEDASGSFMPVDMEYLADKNPDYILFMAHANPVESLAAFEEEFATNAAWNNFDAVKNGKVIALETEYFGMSANLLAVDAMEKLANILYMEQ